MKAKIRKSSDIISMASPQLAEHIKVLNPYDPVSSLDTIKKNPGIEHYKLDWNESTIPPSPQVTKALVNFLQNNEIETGGLRPTIHAISLTNAFREDELRQPLERDKVLANAPEKEDGNFVVPKVVG